MKIRQQELTFANGLMVPAGERTLDWHANCVVISRLTGWA